MTFIRLALVGVAAAFLTACNAVEINEREVPVTAQALARDYSVATLNIDVPRDLKVSEANLYFPIADIVWREELSGDRYAQVEAIFEDGMAFGVSQLRGSRRVVVDVEVARFHSLTQKARYSIGGVHSIKFYLTISDAATGAVIEPRRFIEADFTAFGGSQAVAAEAREIGRAHV